MDTLELRLTPQNVAEALVDPEVEARLREAMWRRGDLSHQLREHGQRWAAEWIQETYERDPGPKPMVLETHRRFGKSYFWAAKGSTRCILLPGQCVKYAAPDKIQCREIVLPNLLEVLSYCPQDMRPRTRGLTFIFRGRGRSPAGHLRDSEESVFQLLGVNANPDSLRGQFCDECYLDEAGYMNRLEYVIEEVVGWQFLKRKNPFLGMTSTPPGSMAHPWITKYVPEAIAAKRYFLCRASDNPDFTREDEAVVLQITKGKETVAWQREAECEHVTDPSQMIVPEWLAVRNECVREVEQPDYFLPECVADLGFSHYTHALFAYVHFLDQVLVVEREFWIHYETLGAIAERWRECELLTWPEPEDRQDLRRLADADVLALESLSRDHHLPIRPVVKYDAEAALAKLRYAIGERRIVIHPRCEQLIYQLDNGVWNERRTDWLATDTLGHCDGIVALVYLNRMARWNDNPFPLETRDQANTSSPRAILREREEERGTPPVVKAFRRKPRTRKKGR